MTNLTVPRKLVSRVAFCPKCYAKGKPEDGDFYTVYGGTSKQVWWYRFDAPEKRANCPYIGFTPHFFTLDKVENDTVYVIKSCGIEFCGSYWITDEAGMRKKLKTINAEEITMTIKEWHALCNFSDSGYKL